MLRVSLIAIIAMFMISDQVVGQNQSSRRGRFLQRLRDDIFGNTPTPQKQNPQASRAPTPIGTGASSKETAPSREPGKNYGQPGNRPNQQRPTAKRSGPAKRGFGFTVAMNDKEKLYVSQVAPGSNAAEAGIRRGDRVQEIGGIEANSVQEFDEIAKIMQAGDQMEFKILRGGRDQKLNVQYGEAPAPDKNQLSSNSADVRKNAGQNKRYDFAPPRDAESVLDSPIPQNQPRSIRPASQRQPVSQRLTDQVDSRQIEQMQKTINQQSGQIQRLQREIKQLRRGGRSR